MRAEDSGVVRRKSRPVVIDESDEEEE